MPEKVQKWRDLRQEKPCRNIGRNIENIPFRDVFFVRLGSSILAHQSIPRKYWIRQNMLLPHFWENVKKMEAICDELGYSHCIINNGTGHDSMIMTDFADTNMIYVPSRNGGVSHCPEEWSEYEDVKKGADVLLNLIMELGKEEEK